MAMAMTLVVVLPTPREAAACGQIRVRRRLAAALQRFLSERTALLDHGATLDDLPSEFFRFPPLSEEPMTSIHVDLHSIKWTPGST